MDINVLQLSILFNIPQSHLQHHLGAASRGCPPYAKARFMADFFTPNAISDRTIRSSETEGSLFSILATRDWLELMSSASFVWLICFFLRLSCSSRESDIFSSIKSASSLLSLRKSAALPLSQPFASSALFFFGSMFLPHSLRYCFNLLLQASFT